MHVALHLQQQGSGGQCWSYRGHGAKVLCCLPPSPNIAAMTVTGVVASRQAITTLKVLLCDRNNNRSEGRLELEGARCGARMRNEKKTRGIQTSKGSWKKERERFLVMLFSLAISH